MPGFELHISLLVTIFCLAAAKPLTSSELPNYGDLKVDNSGKNPGMFDGSNAAVHSNAYVGNMEVSNLAGDVVNFEAAGPLDSLNFIMNLQAPSKHETVVNPMSASIIHAPAKQESIGSPIFSAPIIKE